MCNKCGSRNMIINFPGSIKHCGDCNCNGGTPVPPNPNYLIRPEGGEDGDFLVKNGNNIIFSSSISGSKIEEGSIPIDSLSSELIALINKGIVYNNTVGF